MEHVRLFTSILDVSQDGGGTVIPCIGYLTNVFDTDITLFGIWHNNSIAFDFNSHQWCMSLPPGCASTCHAYHIGQVDAGGTVSHNKWQPIWRNGMGFDNRCPC